MAVINNLLNNVEFVSVENAAAAAQTALTTDSIDTADWTGVVFVAKLGDVTATSVLGLAVHGSNDDGDADAYVALESPLAYTAAAADADNKLLILDIVRPEKRYVRGVLTRTTADAVVDSIFAVRYGPINTPVTQSTTVLASGTVANAATA